MDIPNPSLLFLFTSFLLLFSLSLASSPPNLPHPRCHDDEASALLQFKQSLTINMCDPSDPSAYPKLESWKMLGGRSNCCSWDGVQCDDSSSQVIGLNLSSSCLYGPFGFNTTLSKLSKLVYLDLSSNHFSHSSIPSMPGLFPQLTYLDLSFSQLSGSVPSSLSQLSSLSSLHLGGNDGLKLKGQTFHALVQNLTRLEHLSLCAVDISSTVPKVMVNLSSLRVLKLARCGLHGQFPTEIFNLHKLEYMYLSLNPDLTGSLPQFDSSSKFVELVLDYTRFNGLLPSSIGKLRSLEVLALGDCSFSGQLPTTLQNLTQLYWLDLGLNHFGVTDPSSLSWLGKRTKLDYLGLDYISLPGEIPAYLANLTQLTSISLQSCHLAGSLPSWLFKITNLQMLDLALNQLQGNIPNLFSQLPLLSFLDLGQNNLSGTVKLDMFVGLEKLTQLFLSDNRLSLIHNDTNAIALGRRFLSMGLGSCNLQHFPRFLGDQDQLIWLSLSNNNISGLVPLWLWNVTKDTLGFIDLSGNFLTGFELHSHVFPWPQATMIYLQGNMFHGPLPIPPTNTKEFHVSANNFIGHISPKFCTLSSLYYLDLSYNNLSGEIPQCLANSTSSLQLLDLRGNKLHGIIPQTHTKSCNLKMLALDSNNLTGKLPMSLSNCSGIEFLSLGDNQIEDVFPTWLGPLRQLKILILHSNRFHGELEGHAIGDIFPKLRIIDISSNNLSGPLPSRYFIDWNAMKTGEDNKTYLGEQKTIHFSENGTMESGGDFSMILRNKGIKMSYKEILESFVAIDFSGNRFRGQIPISIGNLRGLHLLNLSNNVVNGPIPPSLANLSNLESLELAGLTFLSFFNVSNNHLTGSIPHGNQFDVFQNDSYLGNSGLCGNPLSKQCGNLPPSPPSLSKDNDTEEGSLFHFGWEPVAIGYACGFVFGAGLGYLVNTRKRAWIVKIFGEKRRRRNFVRGVGQWDR